MKPLKRKALVAALSNVLLGNTPTNTKASQDTNTHRNRMFQHSTNEKLSPYATINS